MGSAEQMLHEEPAGQWKYGDVALLDPSAPDRNFATLADAPFVYYVRFDMARGNLSRTLMRWRIQLRVGP